MKKLSNFWRLPYSRPPPPAREKARTPAKKSYPQVMQALAGRESYAQGRESYPQVSQVLAGRESYPQAGGQGKLCTGYAQVSRRESYPQVAGKSYAQVSRRPGGRVTRVSGRVRAGGRTI